MATPIKIFIGTVEHTITTPSLTGAQIKSLGEISSDYQLFLEQSGDDKEIPDTESVDLTSGMHFYGLPAATFGL